MAKTMNVDDLQAEVERALALAEREQKAAAEAQAELEKAKLLIDELKAEESKLRLELAAATTPAPAGVEFDPDTGLPVADGEPAPTLGKLIDWLADQHLIDHTARLRAKDLVEQQGFGRTAATD